jgi:type II secretory pathway component PulK
MHISIHNRPRGIALIVVMLVIVVLGLLAAGFAYSMRVEMSLAQNAAAESELLWLGRSGVELACWYLSEKGRDPLQAGFDALNQRWAGGPVGTNEPVTGLSLEYTELGRGSLSIQIIDLERRFNINLTGRETLEKAMEVLGYDLLSTATVLDSLEDWRDPDDVAQLHGAESDTYLNMPRPYVAKNGPIDDLSELLLVQGVTPELLWGVRARQPGSTVASDWPGRRLALGWEEPLGAGLGLADLFNTFGAVQININTASREVLQLLPGMDANLAQEIVRHRSGPDGVDGTEADTPFLNVSELINVLGGMTPQYVSALSRICSVRSQTFEIRVRVRVNQYERTYVTIVRRPGSAAVNSMMILNAYWDWERGEQGGAGPG